MAGAQIVNYYWQTGKAHLLTKSGKQGKKKLDRYPELGYPGISFFSIRKEEP